MLPKRKSSSSQGIGIDILDESSEAGRPFEHDRQLIWRLSMIGEGKIAQQLLTRLQLVSAKPCVKHNL